MVPMDITNGTEDLKSVTKCIKSLYKAEQATQKRTSDGAPLKKSNQGPLISNKKQKTRAPFGGTHKKKMCNKAKFQDKPPYEWVNCYYNCNGNKYRPEFIQGGGGGRGYQGGWGYQGQGQVDERVYHNRRDGRGPGRGNYQGTSGNQVGSNYQGNNNGGQNNNYKHASPSTKRVFRNLCENTTASKMIPCVRTYY